MRLVVCCFFLLVFLGGADRYSDSASYVCYTDQVMQNARSTNPELQRAIDKGDRTAATAQFNNDSRNLRASYTLPVVFHIIHNNGPENISDSRVLAELDNLNNAFANTGYYDQNTGVNTNIEFCLAKRDPIGSGTTGITRTLSPLTDLVVESDDIAMKNLSRWKPTDYVNIWIVKEICSTNVGCGVAGYAYLPALHGLPQDGLVIEARRVGTSTGDSGAVIHELGHYLGLYHTFQGGCTNNDCAIDGDQVCDTPPDQSTVSVPCGADVNSCSTDVNSGFASDQNDMYINYMDYGDWDCYSALTQGQANRMEFFILNDRKSLLQSFGCLSPCTSTIAASFTIIPGSTVNIGDPINFINTSTNATNYEWYVDGILVGTNQDESQIFNSIGSHSIALYAFNNDPNCLDSIVVNIQVVCPVEAAFDYPPGNIDLGNPVVFDNGSVNGTVFSWEVNGMAAGSSEDLVHEFSSEGIFEICLTASNGICEDEFCQFVAVDTSETCEVEGFYKTIGLPSRSEEGTLIVPTPDGDLLAAISAGNNTLLVKMDINGDIIWSKESDLQIGMAERVTELMLDTDGNWVGMAYGYDGSGGYKAIAFKFDQSWTNSIWVSAFNTNVIGHGIMEPYTGADYIITMQKRQAPAPGVGQDGMIVQLDRNTGAKIGSAQAYNLGSSETFISSIVYNNELYAVGLLYSRFFGGCNEM